MLSGPRLLASASEASEYMLHEYLVRNDEAHRTANRWHGGGAKALGLPQRVSRRRLIEVLEGRVPGTDLRLGRVVDGKHQHRPGWDATFSAPKSVSLEALLYDSKAVMRAHDAAVRATLDWMEGEFLQTRGYDPATGRRPRVKADGLVAATFRVHVASRNNDPQLHTHAVIANMTRNAAGEWRSVESTALKRNRRLIGAWYRNDLARRLGEMGYVLVPTQVGGLPSFELAGYSRRRCWRRSRPGAATSSPTWRRRAGTTARRPRRRRPFTQGSGRTSPDTANRAAPGWFAACEPDNARYGRAVPTTRPSGGRSPGRGAPRRAPDRASKCNP